MDQIFNIPFVADRLNMSQAGLWMAPILTVLLLWLVSRMSARRSTGVIFYSGGDWVAKLARFSFSATLIFAVTLMVLRAEPNLLFKAQNLMSSLSGLIERALTV